MTIEVAAVPGADDMSDETLFKHLDARHREDLGLSSIDYSPLFSESLIASHRAYHRRIHAMAMAGRYDHEHLGEN